MINMQQESCDSTCDGLVALVKDKMEEEDQLLEQCLPEKSVSPPAAVISMSFHVRRSMFLLPPVFVRMVP